MKIIDERETRKQTNQKKPSKQRQKKQCGRLQNPKSSLTLKKIHRWFLNNLKSEETKTQIKAYLSYLAYSYFYKSKPSPRILRQHRVLRNLRTNKDIFITKLDKENGVVILDQKFYNIVIEGIISDTSKFEKLSEDPTLKCEASLQRFLRKLKQKKTFLMKSNMINCILLVLLLLVSMVLLKCTNSSLVIHFLNFVRLFHL